MKKFIIILLIIIVAVVIISAIKSNKVEVDNVAEETGGASGQFAKLAPDALVVQDQLPGDVVVLGAVNLSKAGFVVIRRDDAGKFGAIIGVSEFLVAGAHSKIDVGTTESLLDGMRYYAEPYHDSGDGIFDPKQDKVVRWNGEDMYAIFNIDKDAIDPRKSEINY